MTFPPVFSDRLEAEPWDDRYYADRVVTLPGSKKQVTARLPAAWSQTACTVLVDKYFRKAGVPDYIARVDDVPADVSAGLPSILRPSVPAPDATFGPETDARQVFNRLAGCWAYWGWRGGYFAREDDPGLAAVRFYKEVYASLLLQAAAPNSPQWFNCFAANTEFITREHGVTTFAETVGSKVTVWTRKGWKPASVKAFGRQPLQRVTFAPVFQLPRGGWGRGKTTIRMTVDVTPDHRWILQDGRQTTAIGVGDVVPTAAVTADTHGERYRDGFRHGVIYGDGTPGYQHKTSDLRTYPVRLCGKKRALAAAFDRSSFPPCYEGDARAAVNSATDLKALPDGNEGVEYLQGFMAGWLATDGSDRPGGVKKLSSSNPAAEAWVRRYAAVCGWTLTGHSVTPPGEVVIRGKKCQQTEDNHSLLLTRATRGWRVVEIEPLPTEEPVYCAVVPGAGEFALASGQMTGNCGLNWAYGITHAEAGHFVWDPDRGESVDTGDAYARPTASACFISQVEDTLTGPGGITDLIATEAAVFKQGSGNGVNVSPIRGAREPLSGGGVSSGLMSFLKPLDASAGSIKSGGINRRAAKMIVLDDDHPDFLEYVEWKRVEEDKVAALACGGKQLREHYDNLLAAVWGDGVVQPEVPVPLDQFPPAAHAEVARAAAAGVPPGYTARLVGAIAAGVRPPEPPALDTDWQGEAYATVSGQNANNSVRLSDAFMRKATGRDPDRSWPLYGRVEKRRAAEELRPPVPHTVVDAVEVWHRIALIAWASADPGIHFPGLMDVWHTVPNHSDIQASNPCSEYLHVNNSACNLASLNLVFFLLAHGAIDVDAYRHAVALWTAVLEITVGMSAYPGAKLAENSYKLRPLGLGYANLGSLLMRLGLAYDSPAGRELAGSLTALMTAEGYCTSAALAQIVGPYEHFAANREPHLRVLTMHRDACWPGQENPHLPAGTVRLGADVLPAELVPVRTAARKRWDRAVDLAERCGLRNSQVTVIAPTGTISLLMDCDTSGVEPDFALVKFKSLAGGGSMTLVNQGVGAALARLGYDIAFVARAEAHVRERMTIEGLDGLHPGHLPVFDCATPCGTGTRSISADAHVDMLAAVQPFLSGSSSKTINLPADCTPADVERVYRRAWEKAVKCVAVYRDGSKLSQPLSGAALPAPAKAEQPASGTAGTGRPLNEAMTTLWRYANDHGLPVTDPAVAAAFALVGDVAYAATGISRFDPERAVAQFKAAVAPPSAPADVPRVCGKERLPARRGGYTQKVRIAGQKMYIRTGEYPDGRLGEIFLTSAREGAAYRSLLDSFAKAVSIALQYGVPLDELVRAFAGTRFEPAGLVSGHARIKQATSPLDCVFRDLAVHYLGRDDLANVTPEPEAKEPAPEPDVNGTRVTEAVAAFLRSAVVATPRLPDGTRTSAEWEAERARISRADPTAEARTKGYTGDMCRNCSNFTMTRAGACLKCETCGSTSGGCG